MCLYGAVLPASCEAFNIELVQLFDQKNRLQVGIFINIPLHYFYYFRLLSILLFLVFCPIALFSGHLGERSVEISINQFFAIHRDNLIHDYFLFIREDLLI